MAWLPVWYRVFHDNKFASSNPTSWPPIEDLPFPPCFLIWAADLFTVASWCGVPAALRLTRKLFRDSSNQHRGPPPVSYIHSSSPTEHGHHHVELQRSSRTLVFLATTFSLCCSLEGVEPQKSCCVQKPSKYWTLAHKLCNITKDCEIDVFVYCLKSPCVVYVSFNSYCYFLSII